MAYGAGLKRQLWAMALLGASHAVFEFHDPSTHLTTRWSEAPGELIDFIPAVISSLERRWPQE